MLELLRLYRLEQERARGDRGAFAWPLRLLPHILRSSALSILDDHLTPATFLSMFGLLCIAMGTAGYIAVGVTSLDELSNGACACIASTYTFAYILVGALKRAKAHDLHRQLMAFCDGIKESAGSAQLASLSGVSNIFWKYSLFNWAMLFTTWAFYTLAPLIGDISRGQPLGTSRRISTPFWPYLCDIHSSPCYEMYYILVAFAWFVGVIGLSWIESCNLGMYMYASYLFSSIGVGLQNMCNDAEALASSWEGRKTREAEWKLAATSEISQRRETMVPSKTVRIIMNQLLDGYICQHQFLLKWSNEWGGLFRLNVQIRVFVTQIIVGSVLLKFVMTEFILDELPFIAAFVVISDFMMCLLADVLDHASGAVIQDEAYLSEWLFSDPDLQRKLSFMILRSKRGVITRTYLMGDVNLRSFLDMIKASFSFLQFARAGLRVD